MSHWTKLDHVTFLVAFILSIVNLLIADRYVGAAIFVFLLIALVYDIYESRNEKRHI